MQGSAQTVQDSASPARVTLAALNRATAQAFVEVLGDIVEHSPWVAEEVWALRPFDSVWSLHATMLDCLRRAPAEAQIALACLHPELAGVEATAGTLTASSSSEQARLGLTTLSSADHARLTRLNRAYRERFGFPFITAVRLHRDLASIFAAFERRLANEPGAELAETMRQIGEVMRGRLARLFAIPLGWLSVHVLDNASGAPAVGVTFDLLIQEGDGWRHLHTACTNELGRTDQPVLCDLAMVRGVYQLEVHVGAYFRGRGVALADPPFLDRVPIRVGIADLDAHYHVPLLCTPWTYSTYRGG